MHESTPTTEGISGVASPAIDVTKLAIHDARHREAYRLHRAGQTMSQIAHAFGVSERTIYRWIESYEDQYRGSIEGKPVLNLIAEELAKLDDLEREGMREAAATKFPTQRRGYLLIALKAMTARHALLLEVGILPREPTKIYGALQELKPLVAESGADHTRTEEQIRDDILALLQSSRTVK